MKLNVNGQEHDLGNIDRDMPLLWALRDKLGLTGTKYGCGRADIHTRLAITIREAGCVTHQAASNRVLAKGVNRG